MYIADDDFAGVAEEAVVAFEHVRTWCTSVYYGHDANQHMVGLSLGRLNCTRPQLL